MVIIGNSGVGKSSLLIRFCDDTFRDMYLTTIGVDFKFKTIDINTTRISKSLRWSLDQEQPGMMFSITIYRGPIKPFDFFLFCL
jgi:Ras-related protein Rab-1A